MGPQPWREESKISGMIQSAYMAFLQQGKRKKERKERRVVRKARTYLRNQKEKKRWHQVQMGKEKNRLYREQMRKERRVVRLARRHLRKQKENKRKEIAAVETIRRHREKVSRRWSMSRQKRDKKDAKAKKRAEKRNRKGEKKMNKGEKNQMTIKERIMVLMEKLP